MTTYNPNIPRGIERGPIPKKEKSFSDKVKDWFSSDAGILAVGVGAAALVGGGLEMAGVFDGKFDTNGDKVVDGKDSQFGLTTADEFLFKHDKLPTTEQVGLNENPLDNFMKWWNSDTNALINEKNYEQQLMAYAQAHSSANPEDTLRQLWLREHDIGNGQSQYETLNTDLTKFLGLDRANSDPYQLISKDRITTFLHDHNIMRSGEHIDTPEQARADKYADDAVVNNSLDKVSASWMHQFPQFLNAHSSDILNNKMSLNDAMDQYLNLKLAEANSYAGGYENYAASLK